MRRRPRPCGEAREQGEEADGAEDAELVGEEGQRIFRMEEVAAEIGIVDRVADGLEVIGGVPGKVGRDDQTGQDQRQSACLRDEGAAHRCVEGAGEGEADDEVEHGVLRQDAETDGGAEGRSGGKPAAAAQAPGEPKPRAPEGHQHAVGRQDAGGEGDGRHQGVEEGGVEACFR